MGSPTKPLKKVYIFVEIRLLVISWHQDLQLLVEFVV